LSAVFGVLFFSFLTDSFFFLSVGLSIGLSSC
jgi:hypothetical protein